MAPAYRRRTTRIYRKFAAKIVWSGIVLFVMIVAGAIGFRMIATESFSALDYLYAAASTVFKTASGELFSLTKLPTGKVLAIVISFVGLIILTFIVSSFTAFLVEGHLSETFRRKKMERMIKKIKDHFIVCGSEGPGFHIITELFDTRRPFVIIDHDKKNLEKVADAFQDAPFIEGDATDTSTLSEAGVMDARGVFAITGDDNQNLVISLTAKQLNPRIRMVAQCVDIKNAEKLRKAGADAVVSPSFIGGLRMASEMIRPTVVSFLDVMLRDKEKNLRIEEVAVPDPLVGKPLSALRLQEFPHVLLLAIKRDNQWIYTPPAESSIKPGDILIFITTPQERLDVESLFHVPTEQETKTD